MLPQLLLLTRAYKLLEYSKNYATINKTNPLSVLMIRSQPHRRRYFGQITFDSQPINWISRHRSFASRQWCESQIRYGEWTRDGSRRGYYLIYADVVEKIEPITVLIIIEYQETHVRILHIHVLRKKR